MFDTIITKDTITLVFVKCTYKEKLNGLRDRVVYKIGEKMPNGKIFKQKDYDLMRAVYAESQDVLIRDEVDDLEAMQQKRAYEMYVKTVLAGEGTDDMFDTRPAVWKDLHIKTNPIAAFPSAEDEVLDDTPYDEKQIEKDRAVSERMLKKVSREVKKLPKDERIIVDGRFAEKRKTSYAKIANIIGKSPSTAQRWEKKALDDLEMRLRFSDEDLETYARNAC